METEFYHCKYCFKQFTPKRRRVQKFCSDTCRSKNHHAKKTRTTLPMPFSSKLAIANKNDSEKMSLAGIGNAAAGVLAADSAKAIFTSQNNKPATKGDLKKLVSEINGRYHPVKNIPPRFDGALPYFDFDTNTVVYMNTNSYSQ